jgi:hypothetical protein
MGLAKVDWGLTKAALGLAIPATRFAQFVRWTAKAATVQGNACQGLINLFWGGKINHLAGRIGSYFNPNYFN